MTTTRPPTTLLVASSDREFVQDLARQLVDDGIEVSSADDLARLLPLVEQQHPSLVLWAIGADGPDLAAVGQLRAVYRGGLVVLVSRRDLAEAKAVEADEVLVRPVQVGQVAERLRLLARRLVTPQQEGRRLKVGALEVDVTSRRALVAESVIDLTPTEFDLLWSLVERAGQVVTREVLHREALRTPYIAEGRSIDVHLSRIRRKLEAAGNAQLVVRSVRSFGYVLVPLPQAEA
jgi:DNA-binding response OmpR family regulator